MTAGGVLMTSGVEGHGIDADGSVKETRGIRAQGISTDCDVVNTSSHCQSIATKGNSTTRCAT
jgi:hypothetical protein